MVSFNYIVVFFVNKKNPGHSFDQITLLIIRSTSKIDKAINASGPRHTTNKIFSIKVYA